MSRVLTERPTGLSLESLSRLSPGRSRDLKQFVREERDDAARAVICLSRANDRISLNSRAFAQRHRTTDRPTCGTGT